MLHFVPEEYVVQHVNACMCPVVLDMVCALGGCYKADTDSVHSWPSRRAGAESPSANHTSSSHEHLNTSQVPAPNSARQSSGLPPALHSCPLIQLSD